MKTLTALILIALLAACGDCPPEVAPLPPAEVVVAAPAPVVEPEPIVTPTPIPVPPTPTPEPVTFCPQSSAGCPPSPTPAPSRPIVIEPNPEPICIRDNTPLVYVEPFWVDNCGNKYGQIN